MPEGAHRRAVDVARPAPTMDDHGPRRYQPRVAQLDRVDHSPVEAGVPAGELQPHDCLQSSHLAVTPMYPESERMAYAEESPPRMRGPINEHASALALEWRRLTRAATAVALLTAPAFFLVLFNTNHLSVVAALIVTVLAVLIFRGLVEVVARKLIPSPSLYGAEEGLKDEDIIARRRYWYWRTKFRRVPLYVLVLLLLLLICQVLFSFAGIHAGFFHPFAGL